MKLLLDQGLPRSAAALLGEIGVDAVHTGDCGLATADDVDIIDATRREGRVVVTLDADFHAHMALSGATEPSVIRVRIEGLRAPELVDLLRAVFSQCGGELDKGVLVSVTPTQVRLRHLPIRRDQ